MRRDFILNLVEDDPTLGPLTADALRMFGHNTTLAETRDAAMRELRRGNRSEADCFRGTRGELERCIPTN